MSRVLALAFLLFLLPLPLQTVVAKAGAPAPAEDGSGMGARPLFVMESAPRLPSLSSTGSALRFAALLPAAAGAGDEAQHARVLRGPPRHLPPATELLVRLGRLQLDGG